MRFQRQAALIPLDLDVESGPQSIALGDMNRDGRSDLVAVDFGAETISIHLADPAGVLPVTSSSEAELDPNGEVDALEPIAVAVADFNNDRNLDVVVANRANQSVSVLLGTADGDFTRDTEPPRFSVAGVPLGIVAVDLDLDNKVDLAILRDNSTVYLLKGQGNGQFVPFPTASISTGSGTSGSFQIVSGLIDSNTIPDLVVSHSGSRNISILFGDSAGTFRPAQVRQVLDDVRGVTLGNFNRDTDSTLDIAVAVETGFDNVALYFTNADGTIPDQVSTRTEVAEFPQYIAALDVDGDTKDDLATGSASDQGGTISGSIACQQESLQCTVPNTETRGGFQLQEGLNTATNRAIVVGDLNGDSHPDLVFVTQSGNAVPFINRIGQVVPTTTPTFLPSVPTFTPTPTLPTFTPTRTPTPTVTSTATALPTAPYGVCNSADAGANGGEVLPRFGRPVALAIGDFDRDGTPDVAVANFTGNRIQIVRPKPVAGGSDPCSVLSLTATLPALDVDQPTGVVAADFDRDGKIDIAASGSAGLSVFYGDGTGKFAAGSGFPMTAGTAPSDVAVGDVDHDGILDLLVSNNGSSDVSLFRGTGGRTFSAPCALSIGSGQGAGHLVANDFNLDGQVDFAVTSPTVNAFTVFQRNKPGDPVPANACPENTSGFQRLPLASLSGQPSSIVSALVDRADSVPDLVLGVHNMAPDADNVVVVTGRILSSGTIDYSQRGSLELSDSRAFISTVAVADVIRDGVADLIVGDTRRGLIYVLRGEGDGVFRETPNPFSVRGINDTTSVPVDTAVADFDRDGFPDVVTANTNATDSGTLSFLVSSRPRATPTPAPTFTPTVTSSPTPVSPSPTPTATSTETPGPSATRTNRPTNTRTALPTATQRGVIQLSNGTCAVSPDPSGSSGAALLIGAAVVWLGGRSRRRERQ